MAARAHSLAAGIIAVLILLISCGKSSQQEISESPDHSSPEALVVERLISQDILGGPLRLPIGLAVDPQGRLYCVDGGNNRVVLFSENLQPVEDVGGSGTAVGLLARPTFVTIDNQLNLYVSDEGNQRLMRFDAQLNAVEEIRFYDPDEPLKFGYPSGIGVTPYGEVWVADRDLNRIAVFNNVGQFDRFMGEFGYPGGQLQSPEKIVRDPSGRFIVCDAGNSRLVVYDQYGNLVRTVKDGEFDYPMASAADRGGWWVLDGANGHIFYLDKRGNRVFKTGPQLPGADEALRHPSDIVLLPDHRLVISDTENNRLLVCRIVESQP